jgi:hypothetical protein
MERVAALSWKDPLDRHGKSRWIVIEDRVSGNVQERLVTLACCAHGPEANSGIASPEEGSQ